jgi:hypothetical protein
MRAKRGFRDNIHLAPQEVLQVQLEPGKVQEVSLRFKVYQQVEVTGLSRHAGSIGTENPQTNHPVGPRKATYLCSLLLQ